MTVTKANADVLDLTDAYAFSGTVTGAGTSGGWEFISETTFSSTASWAYTGMIAGYDYRVKILNLLPATDTAVPYFRLGVTGPTYRTSGYISNTNIGHGQTTFINILTPSMSNVANEDHSCIAEIMDPVGTNKTLSLGIMYSHDSGSSFYCAATGGFYNTAESHTAMQFILSTGAIASGRLVLERRVNT
jgi:hypothetical protein